MRIEYLADRQDLVPEIARAHFEEWGHLTPGQTMTDRMRSLRKCSGRGGIPAAFVATSGEGGLLGTALLLDNDMKTRQDLTPWLGGVYVEPAQRGRGVATALVQRVASEAQSLDVVTLYLYTLPALEAFYARMGWSTLERCDYKGLNVIVMARAL